MLLGAAPASAVDLVGVTSATFSWAAASGPVASYRVFVARDTDTFPTSPETTVSASTLRVTLGSSYGHRIKVRLAAASSAGVQGPYSASSDDVRFVAPTTPPPPTAAAIPAFDLDGNGASDLVLRTVSSGAIFARTLTSSTLRSVTSTPASQGTKLVDVGDYDGDGIVDLLWRKTTSGELVICRGNRSAADDCRSVATLDPQYVVTAVGDVNGDGKRDVVIEGNGLPTLLCLGFGPYVSSCGSLGLGLPTWRVHAGGDADGDGKDDLLVELVSSSVFLTCKVSGTTIAICFGALDLDEATRVRALPDLNGDHRADLLVRVPKLGLTMLCPRDATGAPACVVFSGPPSSWTFLGAGDYDGDGRPDLVWRDPASGQVRVDLLSGTAAKGAPVLISVSTSYDVLVE
ncbi:MAG TPA: VCBS repeat-containing protein [Myxococcota bacterium]|jgi:hypothetical protein|nr:VCBS repeat-containing protein [Myxococcota bacterium]